MADEVAVVDSAEVPAVAQQGDSEAEVSQRSGPVPVVEELTDKQREKWLKEPAEYPRAPKRERPAKVSKSTDKADSSTADEVDDKVESSPTSSPEQVEDAETASAPATDEPTQEKGKQPISPAEQRIKALISETKQLKQRLAQFEQQPAKQPEKPAEPAANAPQRPDPKKFETLDEYFEALSDYKVNLALTGERERVAKEAQESMQARRVADERQQWNDRVREARKKYADYDSIALNPDLPVTENSAIDWWVMNSEHGAEVLYHYGKNPDQLEALNQMSAHKAALELAKVELSLLNPATPEPATVAVPKAPRPPSEANPRGKLDPLAAALQAGDFSTYRRLKDAEERRGRS